MTTTANRTTTLKWADINVGDEVARSKSRSPQR